MFAKNQIVNTFFLNLKHIELIQKPSTNTDWGLGIYAGGVGSMIKNIKIAGLVIGKKPKSELYPRDLMKRYSEIHMTEELEQFLKKWLKRKYQLYGTTTKNETEREWIYEWFLAGVMPVNCTLTIKYLNPKSDNYYYADKKMGVFRVDYTDSAESFEFTIFFKRV